MNPALPGNERGKWASALLAIFVHVALGLFLFYGVRWQNRLPDPVEVELVSPPPPAAPRRNQGKTRRDPKRDEALRIARRQRDEDILILLI